MLLDEPLSALDLKLRQHMRSELRAIQKRTNVTFIYITHDQGEALAMSDRVGVMSNGVLQQVGTPQEIYNHPVNAFVASFVGENNVFAGRVTAADGGFGQFETEFGKFKARLGPGVSLGTTAKLYIRPERSVLNPAPAGGNEIPVEVMELTFEGNFINVLTRDDRGYLHMVQVQNDPRGKAVTPGSKMRLSFQDVDGVVLAEATQRRSA
jgi:spermidine/putrescine transport system ATP-binding protein